MSVIEINMPVGSVVSHVPVVGWRVVRLLCIAVVRPLVPGVAGMRWGLRELDLTVRVLIVQRLGGRVGDK